MYFICRTTLVEAFRQIYPTEFRYKDNRSILFDDVATIPVEALKDCIARALPYHLNKKRGKANINC